MSSNPNISGKVLFGCDYFHIMRRMEITEDTGDNKYALIIDAVMKLFLLQWDFSIDEIDASNKLFFDKVNSNTLDETMAPVFDRIINFVRNDKTAQDRLMIEMIAISVLNGDISEDEREWANFFKGKFDYRQSEFEGLMERGINWARAFDYVGARYIESGLKFD
jgi:hypothetical protein